MPRYGNTMLAAASVGTLFAGSALGGRGDVRIEILDRDGSPVPEVAVYLRPIGSAENVNESATSTELIVAGHSHDSSAPTISQHDLSFSPFVSIIETGTAVTFPNDDDVRHHVYSFSPAKRLNMTIDSHSVHSDKPVFDQPGIVTLGCNIHDNMLAYILVVDTPYFARTDGDGAATLTTLAAGEFEINIWTPRLSAKNLPAPQVITHEDGESLTITYQFEEKLFPPHEHSETSLHWENY
jgi:plastocyanin